MLQFYSAHQVNLEATVTASDAVKSATQGADMVVVEWKHKWQSDAADCYYIFTFKDANGNEITTITLDKNFTGVSDACKLGFPSPLLPSPSVLYPTVP